MNELQEVRDVWFSLGVQLDMPEADLGSIRADFRDKCSDCLLQMLSFWLRKTTPSPPSWQRVVDALSSPAIDRPALADKIRRTYCSPEQPSSTFLSLAEIESQMELLENEFEALKDDVYESIKDQPVDRFKAKLTSFKVRDKEYHMDYMKKAIRKKVTVTDIWVSLNKYFNFLNHTILQHILTKFTDRTLQQRMDRYKDKLHIFFRQTRLCDFLQCWPLLEQSPPTEELRQFVVKSTKNWDTCTLEDLDNMKGRIATMLLLPDFLLILEKASRGCVEVTFSIPLSLVAQLQADIKKTAVKEMADMEIESITVDGVVCYEAPLLQYIRDLKKKYTSMNPLQPLSDSKPRPLLPFRLARIEKH